MGINYGNSSGYKSCREFIDFIQPDHYVSSKEKKYSGHIDIKLTCRTELYIGSGFSFMPEKSSQLVYQTMMYDNKPIIPGSSFKGVVRNIASAVSNSCLPKLPDKNAFYPRKIRKITCKEDLGFCIVCDMFGGMSKASRVIFSDLVSENARLKIKEYNAQFSPKKYTDNDKTAMGYKLYRSGVNTYDIPDKIKAQVVEKGAVFSGRIFFKKLTKEQLSLLMFSMGLNDTEGQDIVLKIGGFKNEGIGEVKASYIDFVCSGELSDDPGTLAYNYYDMKTANKDAIEMLCRDILVP